MVGRVDIENLTLSVEHVHIFQIIIEKCLLGEVLLGTTHFHEYGWPFNLFFGVIVDEMVVHQGLVMKESHEDAAVIRTVYERANDKRVWQPVYWHREVIQLNCFVDLQLICKNGFKVSSLFVESP